MGGYLVEPADAVGATFRLFGTGEGCPPAGRYRFGRTYRYAPAEAVRAGDWTTAEKHRFVWGFAVDLPPADS